MSFLGRTPSNAPLTTADIPDGIIVAADLAPNSVDSSELVDGGVDLSHMSSESVDEDNLHISNAGSNGEFLSKQSGNAGGLTWAAAGGGKILRAFYDESDAAQQTICSGVILRWDELELSITGTNNTSNYLQVVININGICDLSNSASMYMGLAYQEDSWGTGTTFGSQAYYGRAGFHSTADTIIENSSITVRATHPVTGTYTIRPILLADGGAMNVNQEGTASPRSTISAFEIEA